MKKPIRQVSLAAMQYQLYIERTKAVDAKISLKFVDSPIQAFKGQVKDNLVLTFTEADFFNKVSYPSKNE
jgi:hypothetical protein